MIKDIYYHDFDSAYIYTLEHLLNRPDSKIINRKGQGLHECQNYMFKIHNLDFPYAFCRNPSFKYLIGELIFYLRGENKLENISNYSKFWKKCSDDGETLNSCYGYYIFHKPTPLFLNNRFANQFEYCLEALRGNLLSKKAVMTIYNGGEHSYKTNDNPCTMYLNFAVRDGKLNMTTCMRSNDIWFGTTYDVPFFVFVQKMMLAELQRDFPEIELGTYTHFANSLHLYDRNFDKARQVLKKMNEKFSEIMKEKFRKTDPALLLVPPIDSDFFTEQNLFDMLQLEQVNDREKLNHPFLKFAFDCINEGEK